MAVVVTVTALVAALLGTSAAAVADSHKPYPTRQQVERAQAEVASKARSVATLRAELVIAQQRLTDATNQAETAAEDYNGALWKLSVAKGEATKANHDASVAAAHVASQRAEIARLVTQSYQEGTDLNAMTAVLSAEGPTGLMNRMGVVESAGDSMQARYDRYAASNALAKVYAAKAHDAEARQEKLAQQARSARDRAAALATSAQAMAGQIAHQRDTLIADLAKAQKISVGLAAQRQDALEKIAREKAAAAARAAAKAKAKAEAAAAAKAAHKAQQEANQAGSSGGSSAGGAPAPGVPPVSNPAPSPKSAVARAIAFAKSQLGKPYQWGAAGPSTFDCSGLTMRAWQQGGISLPHYSVAQYYQSTPISMADIEPGDLLFFSSNGSPSGIHHVALYIGGGTFIEAPHTGADVRYNSIYNWYPDFAARP